MDFIGLGRRIFGLAGIALVYFGVKDQAGVDAATHNLDLVLGGGMYLVDFVYSVYAKLVGK